MDYISEYRRRHPKTGKMQYRCIMLCPECGKETEIEKGAHKKWKHCTICSRKGRRYGKKHSIFIGGLTVQQLAKKHGFGAHTIYKRISDCKGDLSLLHFNRKHRGGGRGIPSRQYSFRGEMKTTVEIASLVRMSKSYVFARLKEDPNYYNR